MDTVMIFELVVVVLVCYSNSLVFACFIFQGGKMKGPKDALENSANVNHASVISSFMGITNLPRNENEVDFSEYEWMGHEMEEFDKKCLEDLWEEAFIEAMFEDMLDEEETICWLLGALDADYRIELVREMHQISELAGEESLIPEVYLLEEQQARDYIRPDRDIFNLELVRSDSLSSLSSFLDSEDEETER
ncbi:hypothetical protein CAPTEDRAFT_213680 [Capitella teleta]|uniref:Ataxin-2 C-terminal domain-containing protein n=1 Tax=Capitella teleta TaxID=283909 RepID=R7V8L3_CAPTE|nr:hypothetical protein CAPTEDRAFT_213680 [Capitella teleta]|eukprot:ELU14914.1 hypothetical protein CAPTEDRAFT_213680 [Capitella teleta]